MFNKKSLTLGGLLTLSVVVTSALLLAFIYMSKDAVNKEELKKLKLFAFLFFGLNMGYVLVCAFAKKLKMSPLILTVLTLLVATVNLFYGSYMIVIANDMELKEGFGFFDSDTKSGNTFFGSDTKSRNTFFDSDKNDQSKPEKKDEGSSIVDVFNLFNIDANTNNVQKSEPKLENKVENKVENNVEDSPQVDYTWTSLSSNRGKPTPASFKPLQPYEYDQEAISLSLQNEAIRLNLDGSSKKVGPNEKKVKYTAYATGATALALGCGMVAGTFLGRKVF